MWYQLLFSIYFQLVHCIHHWSQNKYVAMGYRSWVGVYRQIYGIRAYPTTPSWSMRLTFDGRTHRLSVSDRCRRAGNKAGGLNWLELYQSDPEHCASRIRYDDDAYAVTWRPSHVRLLAMEYTHPSSPARSFPLTLPHSFYWTGNELLSAAMVKWLLEHSYGTWIPFDERYAIHAIDQDLHIFHLGYHQYVELDEDSYTLKTM